MNADFDLARGALAGEPQSLRVFEAIVSTLPVSDEARQVLRHRALVDRKLEAFDGRGPLRTWLKTVALRLEVDLTRAHRDDAVEDRVLEALMPPSAHLEAELVRSQSRQALREAVRTSLDSLTERERLWIQHHYLDGLTLTAIGKVHGVAPSTVMRALEKAVVTLQGLVRAHLRQVHGLGLTSLDSLVRAGVS
ncbi:MAG: sigma-70 family RNA polymerase sigma factor [Myxococcaceae bacterium]|nr:sigma-70 family RNA polymerase sigma factor [Myxococcaceae bacterium]